MEVGDLDEIQLEIQYPVVLRKWADSMNCDIEMDYYQYSRIHLYANGHFYV